MKVNSEPGHTNAKMEIPFLGRDYASNCILSGIRGALALFTMNHCTDCATFLVKSALWQFVCIRYAFLMSAALYKVGIRLFNQINIAYTYLIVNKFQLFIDSLPSWYWIDRVFFVESAILRKLNVSRSELAPELRYLP